MKLQVRISNPIDQLCHNRAKYYINRAALEFCVPCVLFEVYFRQINKNDICVATFYLEIVIK